jgi:hypothetical protein
MPPGGTPPWLTAVFDDGNSPGSVEVTLALPGLLTGEFVSDWLFNLDPAMEPTLLQFAQTVKTGSFSDPVITTLRDGLKANGDGYMDIEFAFSVQNNDVQRFGFGESVAYAVTGVAGLTAHSFGFLSSPTSSPKALFTAACVQGIAGTGSGWVTISEPIPDPAGLSLLALGVPLILRGRSRRLR